MKKSTIYKTAVKLQPAFKESDKTKKFSIAFEGVLKNYKQFFMDYSNEDFYYLFFYCYFLWNIGKILPQEKLDSLIDDSALASEFSTTFEAYMVDCESCKGDGEEECYNCDDGEEVCPECNGTGVDDEGEDCLVCHGGTVSCDVCDGTGTLTCDDCNGGGEVESDDEVELEGRFVILNNKDDVEDFETALENNTPLLSLGEKISVFNLVMPMKISTDFEEGVHYPNKIYKNPERAGMLLKQVFIRNARDLEYYLDYDF